MAVKLASSCNFILA